ncbi:hypothetical protein [Polaribacter aestuariivivens]|uniref:hypothetical protein n=1 Tax=Polaribacter aestuariivivens TaxID=2304626 RepID=UPI003F49AF4D
MKNLFKSSVLILLLNIALQTSAQDVAYNDVKGVPFIKPLKTKVVENKSLEDGKYTYDNSIHKVIVEIEEDTYTEFYPKGEYIKAKMVWLSENEYELEIVDINKKNLPFKVGDKLTTTIQKNRGKRYYYESAYEDRSWTGKLTKIIEKK